MCSAGMGPVVGRVEECEFELGVRCTVYRHGQGSISKSARDLRKSQSFAMGNTRHEEATSICRTADEPSLGRVLLLDGAWEGGGMLHRRVVAPTGTVASVAGLALGTYHLQQAGRMAASVQW